REVEDPCAGRVEVIARVAVVRGAGDGQEGLQRGAEAHASEVETGEGLFEAARVLGGDLLGQMRKLRLVRDRLTRSRDSTSSRTMAMSSGGSSHSPHGASSKGRVEGMVVG
ncbi:hypothetical protein Tdes44962_MAKER09761, partial [Teratosphaeria destructans]